MRFSMRLPGGKLKIRTIQYLRTLEEERRVPVIRIGRLYVSWWPDGSEQQARQLRQERGEIHAGPRQSPPPRDRDS